MLNSVAETKVQLLLTDENGNAVHRTHYSDNFITLLPGEQETILVRTSHTQG
ncbi:MAG: hypothetical protein II494_03600, partial [Bacilli bacterium]|nr:hypothetical protein [Bacilli bacterium]